MNKYRVTLLVEAKDAEEAGAFVGTLGAPKHLQWDQPLHSETLEIEPLKETLDSSTTDAIAEHIRRRREDPEFMARLEKLREEDALALELLRDGGASYLLGPRTCFFIVHGGGAEGQLTLHASSEVDFIAQIACEEFGGEPNGPGSLADAAFDLADGTAGALYSIPDLDTFGIGFHSKAVPNAKILQLALRCSEEQATHLRALVERHHESSRSGDPATGSKPRTYSVLQPVEGEAEMIPVCPQCLSEEVEGPKGSESGDWRCSNCGACFEVPVEASS